MQTSSSASIPPLVITSSSSSGRRPCTDSSRPATASSVPASPRVGVYWKAVASPFAANSSSSCEARSRGNVSGSGKPPANEIRSGRPRNPSTKAMPSPTSPRVRSAKSCSQLLVSGVTAICERYYAATPITILPTYPPAARFERRATARAPPACA